MQTRQFALHLLVRLKTAISKIIDNKVTDGSRNREYNYDKLGRLTKVKGGVNGTLWNQQYAYDRWGNRTGITQTGTSGSGGAFIPLDGLASLSYNTATNRITSTNFAYDAAGNQTQSNENGQINTYKYDAAGRLVEVSSGGLTHTYAYGASNQRLQMVEAGAQGSTTLYVWAGGQTIAEYNGVGSGMAWTKSYVYLGGRLLATDSTSGVQYHHPDRLGTRLVTNTSGGIVSENIGLPFGNTITGESYNLAGSASKKRFTSYDRSDNTKLDYAVNRHYSAAQGRFTQVDPIGMNAVYLTNPQSLNLYSYCYNDPINHVDPDGLFADAGAGAAFGGIIGAIIGAVLGALRVIFGSRGPRTRMGARIERRLPPNETGSKGRRARPSVRAGSGSVEDFIFHQTQPTDPTGVIDVPYVLTIQTNVLGPWWDHVQNIPRYILAALEWSQGGSAGIQARADFIYGVGDSLTFGGSKYVREKLFPSEGNPCSDAYRYGTYASFGIGYGRLAYAGAAKLLPLGALKSQSLSTALTISAARNNLKAWFRGGLFRNYRKRSEEWVIDRYEGNPQEIITAAARTNSVFNTGGSVAATGGAVNTASSPCGIR